MKSSAGDLTGSVIAQKYKLLKLLGAGGMGTVYQAQDILVNRTVALKVLKSETDNEESVRRFQREATIAARIESPYCVGLLDFGVSDDRPYLVMPYIDGRPLSDVIDDGPLPPAHAIDIFLQICDGLEAAHSKGVVHRDIKPSNIILVPKENGYSVKILDFGIAKLREPDTQAAKTMTATGEFLGSPKYMSPEQCEGLPADQRSDIYSLGILMYETLTGHPPFRDDNVFAIIEKHRHALPEPIFLTDISKSAAAILQRVTFRCLEKLPQHRYDRVPLLRADLLKANEACSGRSSVDWGLFLGRSNPKSRRPKANSLGLSVVALSIFLVMLTVSGLWLFKPLLMRDVPLEERQIDLALPRLALVTESEKKQRETQFDFKLSAIRRIEGEDSADYLKVLSAAGDFFKSQDDCNTAMKYFGQTAAALSRSGLSKSAESADLFIKEGECSGDSRQQVQLSCDRLHKAIEILSTFYASDEFICVQMMRANCLQARLELKLSRLVAAGRASQLKDVERLFEAVLRLNHAFFSNKITAYPQFMLPALIETGDYFLERAMYAKDKDAVERSIGLSEEAFKAAISQCENFDTYHTALISCWNRLGLLNLVAKKNQDARTDFLQALKYDEHRSALSPRDHAKLLRNLAESNLRLHDYLEWLRNELELFRLGSAN